MKAKHLPEDLDKIIRRNPALIEVVAYFALGDVRWLTGRSTIGDALDGSLDLYANWGLGTDGCSHAGHYGFTSKREAIADMLARAGWFVRVCGTVRTRDVRATP